MTKINRAAYCFLATIITCISASAQKLPAVQQISVKPPNNLKIDGKTTEWDNKFQAFNNGIDAFYTIANDNNNLYLVVKTLDEVTAKKMFGAGIVLSITPEKNKFEAGGGVGLLVTESARLAISDNYREFKEYAGKKVKNKQEDSLLAVINKDLTNGSKEITVSGIPGIDNTISVYNDLGIKSAMLFDDSGALNWELAVPLKYLKNAMNNKPNFFYNLMIKGMNSNGKKVTSRFTGETVTVSSVPRSMISGSLDRELIMNPTDFWGEYKLTK